MTFNNKLHSFTDKVYRHFVIWSGGYDSTLALYRVARMYGTKDNPVVALTIRFSKKSGYNQWQFKAEEKARKNIIKELVKRNIYVKAEELVIDVKIPPHSHLLCQPAWWSTFAVNFIPNDGVMHFGYILGDDFWMVSKKFEQLIGNASEIMGKQTYVCYPVMEERKYGVLRALKKEKLFHLCWSCEDVGKDGKKCGSCEPCYKAEEALYRLKLEETKERKEKKKHKKEKPPKKKKHSTRIK